MSDFGLQLKGGWVYSNTSAVSALSGATAGECAGDIDNFCENIEAGIRRLADCLSEQQTDEEKGNVQGMSGTESKERGCC
jgi:hypothetical protein